MFHRIVIVMMCAAGSQLTSAGESAASTPDLVPRSAELELLSGEFNITSSAGILVERGTVEVRAVADYLADLLRRGTGGTVPVKETDSLAPSKNGIILLTRRGFGPSAGAQAHQGAEEYELIVERNYVTLRAATAQGLFRGVQTLRQLLPPEFETATTAAARSSWAVPCAMIKDRPRYRWRGMLLDCCRHFMSKEFVKRYIDLLAFHKMNVLHWHLTEDQGWRIEIAKYPKLTEVGAWRGPEAERYGGFYTRDDIREIVAYAASRYVTVVPEIEMPGHSLAALASYPALSCTGGPFEVGTRWGVYEDVYCAGNDQVFEFLEGVLTEVMELFPSEYIHIGGDECPKTRWQACPKCQARIETEGLADEHELQSWFIRRIETLLNANGRRLIGWDEILEGGLAPNATVQSWRGLDGAIAAAKAGHDVICSPTSHCYLDYAQARAPGEPANMGFIDLETVYSFEPTPASLTTEQARHVLGAEGNMWTERAPQERVDHQVFPRLCALAEVAWSPKEHRDWQDFTLRMKTHYRRLDALGVNYCRPER